MPGSCNDQALMSWKHLSFSIYRQKISSGQVHTTNALKEEEQILKVWRRYLSRLHIQHLDFNFLLVKGYKNITNFLEYLKRFFLGLSLYSYIDSSMQ